MLVSSPLQRVTQWHNTTFGYGSYELPWRWNPDGQRWQYGPSEGAGHKPYQPSEYVIARIEGRAPRWGARSGSISFDALESKLAALGWLRRPRDTFGDAPGKSRDGVVLYKAGGVVFHAAIFDHARGDWGGKLAELMPIGRFKDPEDFLGDGLSLVSMEFFGPRKNGEAGGASGVSPRPGMQKTDEWMHENAAGVFRSP
jgi:hypothetical protein